MEYASFSLACIAIGWLFSYQVKLKRLERKIKSIEANPNDLNTLKNKIIELAGKEVKISFYDEDETILYSKKTVIREADNDFVRIEVLSKPNKMIIIRLEDIKSIEIKK